MSGPRGSRPKRGSSKETRRLIAAIEEAGGTVETTQGNHLRVTAPGGLAHVGQPRGTRSDARSWSNTLAQLRRIGLDVRV